MQVCSNKPRGRKIFKFVQDNDIEWMNAKSHKKLSIPNQYRSNTRALLWPFTSYIYVSIILHYTNHSSIGLNSNITLFTKPFL